MADKEHTLQQNQRKLLFLSSLGGILEFYDFIIYALFAGYIAKDFFPETDGLTSLIITFGTFAIGYLVRPIGGIVFGHFGDRIGRKSTFTISILMMALATLSMGLIPTYTTIGIAAPILITTLRILQGFSIGGEIPGAIAYVSESLPDKKGFACGIIFCSLTMGIVFGSLVQAIMTTLFNDVEMQSYAWRIPFILGGFFGLISFFLRRELHESSQFIAIENQVEKFPIATVFKQQFVHAITGIFIVALCAVIITQLFLFTPAYFTKVLNLPANAYIWQRTVAIAFGSSLSLLFGFLTDIFNIKKMIFILSMFSALLAYPIFMIYAHYPAFYGVALLASAFLTGFAAGVIPSILNELFPTKIRYSGIAISYNLGFAIFGGLTPFISLSLIYYTGWITVPAFYLIFVSVLTTLSLIIILNHNRQLAIA